MAKNLPNQDALERAKSYFDECRKSHDEFVADVEKRYKVYRGVLEAASDAAQWTSKAHPPYVMHIVETSLASLIDDKLRYRIKPNATMDMYLDPAAGELARKGARAHQILFDWQIAKDGFTRIQRPFALQNAIVGMTVAKTYWAQKEETRRRMVPEEQELVNEFGMSLGITVPVMVEKTEKVVVYDGPTTEVRDVRDFLFPGNAVSLRAAPYIVDRVWKTPDEIEAGFAEGGPFGPARGGWSLKEVADAISTSKDESREELPTREQDLFNIDRTKGLVELWEVWDRERQEVTVVANRVALLAHRKSFPFHHGDYPFAVCSTQPDLFRIPGISQVEKIAHLQTLLWDISNQSLDNLRLVNNAIFMFRPDIESPDEYEFCPGARWMVEDPKQVAPWSPDPIPAEISLGREALIKGDMQNLAGGFPFSSGSDSQFVDQKTATGASIVTNLAQRSLDMAKQQLRDSYEDIGQQRMDLNQQFIREPFVVPILGLDDEQELEEIMPELLSGDFRFTLDPLPDAMIRQEEQAAAMALVNTIAQVYPLVAMAAQNGAATPLNIDAFIEDLIKAHGKDDVARYFTKKTPMALPAGGGGGGGVAPPGASAQSPMGVTAQQSIDPSVSPSSQQSLSPIAALQRAQALDRS